MEGTSPRQAGAGRTSRRAPDRSLSQSHFLCVEAAAGVGQSVEKPNSDDGNVIQGPLHLTPASPVALPQPHPCPVFPPRWCWSCCCIEAFQPGAAEDQPPEGGDPRPGPAPRAQQMTERSGVSIWLGWQVWRCKGQRAEVLRWPVSRHRKCGYISQVQFRPRIGCL